MHIHHTVVSIVNFGMFVASSTRFSASPVLLILTVQLTSVVRFFRFGVILFSEQKVTNIDTENPKFI